MPAVTRLTLTRFRNYRSLRLETTPQPVVLCGPNGAGKTNLLEALSFLSPGRGLRRARLDDMETGATRSDTKAWGTNAWDAKAPALQGWAVAATVTTGAGSFDLGTGCAPPSATNRRPAESRPTESRPTESRPKEHRVVRIDGQPARSQTVLTNHIALLWLTPQMDRLFIEGSNGRRRFLDRLVFGFDPAHAGRLSRYEHALRERGRLLRDGIRDDAWLSALEDQMATTGVAITAARRDVVSRLNRACTARIGPFPRAELAVTGAVEAELCDQPALPVEDSLRKQLHDARRTDAHSGSAPIGPHRSDFLVSYRKSDGEGGRMPAESCSTGEQKALLLAIVLANARLLAEQPTGAPLLLLDEVAAHLDGTRRRALFAEILALDGQAWLTGTDALLFEPLREQAQFIAIADGQASMMDRYTSFGV